MLQFGFQIEIEMIVLETSGEKVFVKQVENNHQIFMHEYEVRGN